MDTSWACWSTTPPPGRRSGVELLGVWLSGSCPGLVWGGSLIVWVGRPFVFFFVGRVGLVVECGNANVFVVRRSVILPILDRGTGRTPPPFSQVVVIDKTRPPQEHHQCAKFKNARVWAQYIYLYT